MNLLMTGASGLVGSAFQRRANELQWNVVPLRRTSTNGGSGATWNPDSGRVDLSSAGPLDAVVHLAGETVAQRWTQGAKRRIRQSRVEGTRALGRALRERPSPPQIIVCASAIGFYGDRSSEWIDETSSPGSGFLAEVCRDWELAAREEFPADARLVVLRFGMVLTRRGGALAKMLPAFRAGLAGRFGPGSQYWSWITLHDVVRIIERSLVDSSWRGPINAVSPHPVTNAEFTRTLGRVLRRPIVLSLPRFAVSLGFGEIGREMLLSSSRVRPQRLLEAGFKFEHPALEPALQKCLAEPVNPSETR